MLVYETQPTNLFICMRFVMLCPLNLVVIEARIALAITSSQWSRLGQLCNDEPLRQGRHRGKTRVALRDASEDELFEARRIACDMIVAYLQYLKNRKVKTSTSALIRSLRSPCRDTK